jgi:teichoic acid transport system permease protein
MRDRGRLTAPGDLLNGSAPEGDTLTEAAQGSRGLAEMAAEYGLRPSSARPSLASYLRMVWQRRHFIVAYATARNVSMYTEARLGQLWQVLTPLLNSCVYYLIFGIIFEAHRGISNYTAYLVSGVFIFSFTERSIVVGSSVIRANITLMLFAIVLGTGEPLTWYWLLLAPALLMQATFNMGAALILARVGAGAQDVSQLIPFLLRVWRYFCGVMYSIASLPAALPGWAKDVLSVNPAAVYISLTRYAIMASMRADAPGAKPYNAGQCALFNAKKIPALQAYCHPGIVTSELWLAGLGWAVVAMVVGVLYFWQAETRYGRG